MPQNDPSFALFGGGATHTVLHPLVLGVVILVLILTFVLPRKYVVLPLLFGIILIPYSQNIYLGGVHLYMAPLLLLIGWTRVLCSLQLANGQLLPGGLSTLDKVFIVWAVYRAISVVALLMQVHAIPGQVLFLWDALGGYFLFRILVRDEDDIRRIVKLIAFAATVIAAEMVYEHLTRHNFFAFLGGVRAVPEIRAGKIRAQAVFAHALLAGSFGATMLPLFFWLWKSSKSWFFAVTGICSSVAISFLSSESTPILALLGVGLTFFLWPLRKGMRLLRWGIVGGLAGLQLFMHAPVWFLIAHVDLSGASTGWDRAELIDNFIRHFFTWFLFGTSSNGDWGFDMWDQCNQFVLEGETGGLICFICFIVMFCLIFRWIGNARKAVEGERSKEWQYWILGAAVFAQILVYFGIDYFDQMKFVWYLLLVVVSTATLFARDVKAEVPVQQAILSPAWQPITNARWTEKSGLPVRPFRIGHARLESSSAVFRGKPRRAH